MLHKVLAVLGVALWNGLKCLEIPSAFAAIPSESECGRGKMSTHGMDMKGAKVFSCAAAVTGLTAAFFYVSLFGAFSLGKVGFVWVIFLSPVLAVLAVSQWNEFARRLMLSLAAACVAALAVVFVALQVADVTLFYADTVGPLYLLLGLASVFMATLIVAAKF